MKTILLLLLLPAFSAAQSVSIAAGGGAGAFNNQWKSAVPVFAAGLLIDNPIGENSGTLLGLSYRQRASKNPDVRLHAVQFDIAWKFDFGDFSAGAGFFFALTAGADSDLEPPESYTSGVGATGFFAWNAMDRLVLRLVYDHGIGNLSEQGDAKPRAVYLVASYRVGP
jgi:hypothetical protein